MLKCIAQFECYYSIHCSAFADLLVLLPRLQTTGEFTILRFIGFDSMCRFVCFKFMDFLELHSSDRGGTFDAVVIAVIVNSNHTLHNLVKFIVLYPIFLSIPFRLIDNNLFFIVHLLAVCVCMSRKVMHRTMEPNRRCARTILSRLDTNQTRRA